MAIPLGRSAVAFHARGPDAPRIPAARRPGAWPSADFLARPSLGPSVPAHRVRHDRRPLHFVRCRRPGAAMGRALLRRMSSSSPRPSGSSRTGGAGIPGDRKRCRGRPLSAAAPGRSPGDQRPVWATWASLHSGSTCAGSLSPGLPAPVVLVGPRIPRTREDLGAPSGVASFLLGPKPIPSASIVRRSGRLIPFRRRSRGCEPVKLYEYAGPLPASPPLHDEVRRGAGAVAIRAGSHRRLLALASVRVPTRAARRFAHFTTGTRSEPIRGLCLEDAGEPARRPRRPPGARLPKRTASREARWSRRARRRSPLAR